MDEEDLQELTSSKRLGLTEEFDLPKDEHGRFQSDFGNDTLSNLASGLMGLVAPAHESMGAKLLQKMGWRQGQGIGPRIAQMDIDVTFAPADTPIQHFNAKADSFGLGYDLVENVPQVAEMRRYQQQKRDQHMGKAITSKRAGFGVGVYEDENDDVMPYDDGISTRDLPRDYHHVIYDEDHETLLLHRQSARPKSTYSRPSCVTRCSDGHLPMNGFHISTAPYEHGKWYLPPDVPDIFDEFRTVLFATTKAQQPRNLTMDARGAVLGEQSLGERSVFDFMSTDSKKKLKQAAMQIEIDSKAPESNPLDKSKLRTILVSKEVAELALQGFIPFGDNLEKQRRYRKYLQICSQQNDNETSESQTIFPVPAGLSYDSGMKEMDEFIKSAKIFRPISGMMSSRFTTASNDLSNFGQSLSGEPSGKLEQVVFEGGLKSGKDWKKERDAQAQTQQEPSHAVCEQTEAATMGMFGSLTRTAKAFYPNRLVCKRFNVPNPHPDHLQEQNVNSRTQAGSSSILSDNVMGALVNQTVPNNNVQKDAAKEDPMMAAIIARPSMQVTESPTADQETQEDSQNIERPSLDIFKSIFENSDDESVDTNENEDSSPHLSKQCLATVEESDDFIGPSPPQHDAMTTTAESNLTDSSNKFAVHVKSEEFVVPPFQSRLASFDYHERSDRERTRSKHTKRKRDDDRKPSREIKHSKKKKEHKKRRHRHDSSRTDLLDDLSMWVEKKTT
ncbi:hypothetical protein DM01DRAFT_1385413 [Hesseltinella vesiculosa]|uniref:G-patch domain-containing protein n=1 Tax=Hesseltinella vesiculosa TaxID=101127 RepID=A0A1X2GBA7_9FUNG|nr:hypothetical protein DM01DRAFT_1385413 [Hesseltinella vesiculosa]